MKRFGRFLRTTLGALAACVSLGVGAAWADDVADEADIQFNLGTERYQAGDYENAIAHFLASNRLARNRNVLFNIARCYEQLHQFPEAHRYYGRALEGERDAGAIERIDEAIERIAPHVALLRIVTDPPGARLYLDRKDLGERGVSPQRMALPPGSYRVVAELDGYDDKTSDPVELTLGHERAVTLRLRRIVGTIRVTGPIGASVRLDADNAPESCAAPCEVKAAPGQHTVILTKEGFRAQHEPVSVEAEKVLTLRGELAPETASLVVNSDERDAAVDIDGYTQGFTPAILTVPVGPHHVTVRLRGFKPVERDVVLKAAVQSRIDVQLFSIDSVEAASRVPESVEDAPASVSIVGSQELRAMRYPTVAEALRGVRGIYVSDDRGYESLGFRGFGLPGSYGNRVLVTLDGMPLNDDWVWSSYVGYDLRTDLEDVERIEVVRGPGSVVYGTSAFSGVINLVSRGKDVPSGVELAGAAAGEGVGRARARITEHFGPDAGIWTSVAAGQSQGRDFFFPEYVSQGPPEVAGNARGVDGARFGNVIGRLWWKDLSLAWSFNTHDKHLPTGQFDTLLGDARTHQADTRALLEARYEPRLFGVIQSLTRLHGDAYAYRGYFARSPEDGGVETNAYDSYWAGAEQRFVVSPSPAFSMSLGGEAQAHPHAHEYNSTEYSLTTTNISAGGQYFSHVQSFVLGALYGSVDARPVEALKLSAGARLDYYSTFGSSFNPRVAVIGRPYPGGNVKVMFGKAFRAPSIYEQTYLGIGQIPGTNLRPENAYSAEVEWSQRITPQIMATASAYTNYVRDLIALQAPPASANIAQNVNGAGCSVNEGCLQYQNTSTPVATTGAEIELRRDWKDGWMVAASYSFQRSVFLASSSLADLVALRKAAGYREVPNSPMHLASLRGAVPILSRALSLMSRLSFEGPRYDVNDTVASGVPQTRTQAAVLWDFVFSGVEAHWHLTYSVGIYNALDCRASYPVSSEFIQTSIPITGRSLLASVALSF